MINREGINDYTQAIDQGEKKVKQAVQEAEKKFRQTQEQLSQWASKVDHQVHENPWPALAGVAVGFLMLGLIMGRSRE